MELMEFYAAGDSFRAPSETGSRPQSPPDLEPAEANKTPPEPEAGRFFRSENCVCCDAPANCAALPCGHIALCGACSTRVPARVCVMCRADVTHFQIVIE